VTIPRKNSRTIEVDGVRYRWVAGRQEFKEEGTVHLTFTAHEDKEPSSSNLTVVMLEKHCASITPAVVVNFIRGAIQYYHWDPKSTKGCHVNPHAVLRIIGG
jgi:hypothetical protein